MNTRGDIQKKGVDMHAYVRCFRKQQLSLTSMLNHFPSLQSLRTPKHPQIQTRNARAQAAAPRLWPTTTSGTPRSDGMLRREALASITTLSQPLLRMPSVRHGRGVQCQHPCRAGLFVMALACLRPSLGCVLDAPCGRSSFTTVAGRGDDRAQLPPEMTRARHQLHDRSARAMSYVTTAPAR